MYLAGAIASFRAAITKAPPTHTSSPSRFRLPSPLTNIPNPPEPLVLPLPSPPTSPDRSPPTSLALPWRTAFLFVLFVSPRFYLQFAITGDRRYSFIMGGACLTTCAGSIILYYFASLDQHNRRRHAPRQAPLARFKSFLTFILLRENRSLAMFGFWGLVIEGRWD